MLLSQSEIRTYLLNQLTTTANETKRPMVRKVAPYETFVPKTGQSVDLNSVSPSRLFLWSDQHFFHRNIIGYQNRPFATADQMTDQLIKNYRSVVTDDDVCIFGGDVGMRGPTIINEVLNHLPGYKILIVGNHDFDRRSGKLLRYQFDEVHLFCTVGNYVISHHPWHAVPHGMKQIHGHIHDACTNNSQHINISVERIGYTPISFSELINR